MIIRSINSNHGSSGDIFDPEVPSPGIFMFFKKLQFRKVKNPLVFIPEGQLG
jgi:hypothetical protein